MTIKQVTIVYVVALLLQLSFLNVLTIAGATPNLLLCLTVVIIFKFENGFRCIPFALVAALLQDIFCSLYVGVTALSLFVVACLVAWYRIYFNTDLYKTTMTVGALATLVYGVVNWLLMTILHSGYGFLYMLKHQIFYVPYNVLVMAAIFFFFSDRFRNWLQLQREDDDEEEL
ncbi:MAG: hypothetical protein ACOX41_10220 [Anaerovoracaceae bacterium]|jgi:rod shape-determining protein MreD